MKLGVEVGLGPGHIVLDGDPAGQTAGWIKMPVGMDVGLGSGDIVLDGVPPAQKNGHSPQFSAHVYCGKTVAHLSVC